MMKCPRCGANMSFEVAYYSGTPYVVWACQCGYINNSCRYEVSNRTTPLNVKGVMQNENMD